MSVERRYSKRHPMDGDVYIRYRKQRAFPARSVDCSMQGITLKTESLTLLTGALVELEIFLNGRLWEVMGIVCYTQADVIGVMFWQPQPELYASAAAGRVRVVGSASSRQVAVSVNRL
ncbi:MAG: PilZ domain-containing protein [Candidatus Thiodiazotropha sp.]